MQADADRVIVATDDARIAKEMTARGAEVAMTREDHASGTDRLVEVAAQLGLADDQIVVNLQGDEPLMPATNIKRVAALLNGNSSADMATLMEPLDRDIAAQESIVRVVATESGRALYFSRAPIPGHRQGTLAAPMYRHVGLYAYRVGFLKKFVTWPLTAMEQSESLEQLRALANDAHIQIEVAPDPAPTGVDTEADLIAIRQLLALEN